MRKAPPTPCNSAKLWAPRVFDDALFAESVDSGVLTYVLPKAAKLSMLVAAPPCALHIAQMYQHLHTLLLQG